MERGRVEKWGNEKVGEEDVGEEEGCDWWSEAPVKGWQWLQLGLLLGLTGCSGLTTIEKVQQHPHRQWFNNQVELRGKVVDRVPLIKASVYQLEDATGKIWILTTNSSPQPGQQLQVKGKVRFESIPIEGLELGEAYIEEQQREMTQPDGK